MTGAELIDRCQFVLRDADIEREQVLKELNLGLLDICASHPLPALLARRTLAATPEANSAPLPEDFHHGLFNVRNLSRPRELITLYRNKKALLERHGRDFEETGSIDSAATDAGLLWYTQWPVEEMTLSFHYYRLPAEIADSADRFRLIPEHLQEDTLVAHVAAHFFAASIEDALEGAMNNAAYWMERKRLGLARLAEFFPHASRATPKLRRQTYWF